MFHTFLHEVLHTHMLSEAELSRLPLMLSMAAPNVPNFLRAVALTREASCPP